jgi:hypothetical protein
MPARTEVERLYLGLMFVFFFLMLVFPTHYRMERGALLAVLLAGGIVYALCHYWRIGQSILLWSALTVTAGLLFMLLGAMQGAPGALRVGTIHVLWPLLYLFFIGLLREGDILIDLQKAVVLAVLVSACLGIALVVGTLAGYGEFLATFSEQDLAAGMYDGFSRYRMANIPTVVYGSGFVLALISLPSRLRWCSRRWTFLCWVTLLPMIIAIVLSGRRAAWLVLLLVPAIIFGLTLLSRQPFRLRLWLVLVVVFLGAGALALIYFDMSFTVIAQQFMNAFDFSAERSASERGEQGAALLAGWAEHPLLGNGLGAAASVIRNTDQPWAYELSYVALLFQTGVVGVTVFASAILWVFWAGIRTVRERPESASVLLPMLAGLACFLVANGTNPYLAKFDYLWVIFLPIAAIKVYGLRRASEVRS